MELTIEQALQQGIAAHKEGKLQEAERLYRAILQAQPAHPDANHNLGVIAVSVHKADVALPLFKTALEANPKIEQFWLSYIDALIREKQVDDAKEVLELGKKQVVAGEKFDALEEEIKKIAPSKLSEKKKSLTLKKNRKNISESKQQKKKGKNKNPNSASPSQSQLNNLIEQYQNGRYEDAEKLAKSITQQFPKHQFAWTLLGAILKQTGRINESLFAKQTAVELEPLDAKAHYNLGITLQELGRLDEAEASYKQAIALKLDFAQAHYNLGNTLQELGRLDEAEAIYTQAIALKPDFPKAYYNLGIMLRELGRLDEAEASYKQAIALKIDFAEAHSNLGVTLQELGRLDKAEASCRQAIALKPDYAEAHSNLGSALEKQDKLVEALASYTQAIALKPNFSEALFNRSLLLFDIGQFEAALRDADACVLKKACALPLNSLYALGRIGEIYERIEIQSKVDGEDISIAAFAAFISETEKKPTAYNFCPNPIDFIHVANLSSHVDDSVACVAGLIEELNKIETVWEPSGQSTVSGFQTLPTKNLFENPSKKIAQLKSIIINELEAYHLKFQNEQCSYIQKLPSGNNLLGWHVILKHQGHQTAHIHPGGWLSGVIYLKVVPSLGKDEGAIEFSLNGEHYSNPNSSNLTHHPEVGDIVFFPSSLHHKTIPFTTDSDRIIVSFDLIKDVAKH
ncbi:tetratricopeptide repeat protein [Gammaproteobacteria bacterium]|nr:tetratricopeptide repeat protein [Gammaproteobacteria bacterium]